MHVCVYADGLAQEWQALLRGHGHTATLLPPGQLTGAAAADICLVAMSDPLAERFWMARLTTPTLLVTGALGPAQMLSACVPWLRVICHPTRAVQALEDMLQMTCAIHAGVLVFGPLTETVCAAYRVGGCYGVS